MKLIRTISKNPRMIKVKSDKNIKRMVCESEGEGYVRGGKVKT